MELKEGMYVRTDDGKLTKFIKYDENDKNELVTEYYKYSTIWIKDVVKASYSLLDLIQIGDYVNGFPVIHNAKEHGGNIVIVINGNAYNEENIKSVVTKEQFNSVKYEVE